MTFPIKAPNLPNSITTDMTMVLQKKVLNNVFEKKAKTYLKLVGKKLTTTPINEVVLILATLTYKLETTKVTVDVVDQ